MYKREGYAEKHILLFLYIMELYKPDSLKGLKQNDCQEESYMQYQVEENCLTIFLPPEVDHHNAEDIRKEADRVIEEKHIKHVIFDFENTNFMDSSGIGVIMGRYRNIFLLGGEVWVTHANERMRRILSMSGVAKIMQIFEEDEK